MTALARFLAFAALACAPVLASCGSPRTTEAERVEIASDTYLWLVDRAAQELAQARAALVDVVEPATRRRIEADLDRADARVLRLSDDLERARRSGLARELLRLSDPILVLCEDASDLLTRAWLAS